MNNPNPCRRRGREGFTLAELMIASSLGLLVIGATMMSYMQGMRIWQKDTVVNELNMNLETALECIRADMRLSSSGPTLVSFYPADAEQYVAISFPVPEPDPVTGLLQRTPDGKIIWKHTVIYHIRPANPDELVRSIYSPRNNAATPADRYDQLEAVVLASRPTDYQAAALPGETYSSSVIFANLMRMTIQPPVPRFDGYSPSPQRAQTFNYGSIVLDSGLHELTFTCVGKNPASSGLKLGIDFFALSASHSIREGESYLPLKGHPCDPHFDYSTSAGSVVAENMSLQGVDWSGNAQLTYTPPALTNTITFQVCNDLWNDAHFINPVAWYSSNCSVKFDYAFTNVDPFIPDFSVSMDAGLAWVADATADRAENLPIEDGDITVVNYIYGGTNELSSIIRNGCWARFRFEAGIGAPLHINNAFVRPFGNPANNSHIRFGGLTRCYVRGGQSIWSDWVPNFEIDESKDYEVEFFIEEFGDDDIDLFVGNSAGTITFYQNTGTPSSPTWAAGQSSWQGVDVGTYSHPILADMDADGDPDLAMGNYPQGEVWAYDNTGDASTPAYPVAGNKVSTAAHPLAHPATADIDGDGDLDLIVGGQNGRLHFYENTGTVTRAGLAAPDTFWKGIQITNDYYFSYNLVYSAPALADMDGDGDVDMLVGRSSPGDFVYIENVGSKTNFVPGTPVEGFGGLDAGKFSTPFLADIDDDGDMDLFSGNQDGRVCFWENTGSSSNVAWGSTNTFYNGIDIGSYSVPCLANINPNDNAVTVWIAETNTAVLATFDGTDTNATIALAAIEVRYPEYAWYLSGVFDTHVADPVYKKLYWTEVESPPDTIVELRVRSGDKQDLSDACPWMPVAYFNSNMGNDISSISGGRYVQYEARLTCAGDHTVSPILRDVTIDWEPPTGVVDLFVAFGKGPDYGIVTATVDGQTLSKGIEFQMEIFKDTLSGIQTSRGVMEVRPLNTDK